MLSTTITRDVAVHFSPADFIPPWTVSSTARSRLASSRTTTGFFPPISSWYLTPLSTQARAIAFPVATDPVNEIPLTPLTLQSAAPASRPPCTRLNTPGGRPISCNTSVSSCAVQGECSDGLKTTVLPYTNAGAAFHNGIATGKFHGVINPVTPRLTRSV